MDHLQAHRHSLRNRDALRRSLICGCFCCGERFPPEAICDWTDPLEGVGLTALCPECGIDSVIGDDSGFPITPELLRAMHIHWFGT